MKRRTNNLFDLLADADTRLTELVVSGTCITWGISLISRQTVWLYGLPLVAVGLWTLWLLYRGSLKWRRFSWGLLTMVCAMRFADVLNSTAIITSVVCITWNTLSCLWMSMRVYAQQQQRADRGERISAQGHRNV